VRIIPPSNVIHRGTPPILIHYNYVTNFWRGTLARRR
jgi:hypothetical protein